MDRTAGRRAKFIGLWWGSTFAFHVLFTGIALVLFHTRSIRNFDLTALAFGLAIASAWYFWDE
jgi:hypothetical protein